MLAASQLAHGDLAVKRRANPGVVGGGPRVVVKLRRVAASDRAGFFVGDISVGGGRDTQELSVLFDTAAGNIVLPSGSCKSSGCQGKRRYFPDLSSSSQAINQDGREVLITDKSRDVTEIEFSQIDLGDGKVSGGLVRDTVCLGPRGDSQSCVELGIVVADDMTDPPFQAMPHDGMVGLGLDSLTVASPLFMFLRQLADKTKGLEPMFAISLRGQVGELTFGGPGASFSRASPIEWFPVHRPTDGHWQVQILSVRVGNHTIDACASGCRGIVDTGASQLGVPAPLAPSLGLALHATPDAGNGCSGPDLSLDLIGGFALTLRARDYAVASCSEPGIVPLELGEGFEGAFVLGESVLQRYDTIYDWSSKRMGFSLVTPRAVRLGPPTPQAMSDKDAEILQILQL